MQKGNWTQQEQQIIENWTKKTIVEPIFNSDIDDWNQHTSSFQNKLMGKSNLLIVIEDMNNNKFGGYLHSQIISMNSYINDSNSFLFSLQSNGRLQGMTKFEITQSQYAFYMSNQMNHVLFKFGNDLNVYTANMKSSSYCDQQSFNYHGYNHALCGNQTFTPKRFVVFQM